MPKTNEKDAYYFSHDCNARNDPKVLALRSVYGAEGYGVYWMMIEILREQKDYKLRITKYIWTTLAMQMQMQAEHLQEIVDACCTEFTDGGDTGLLVNDGDYLYSPSLLRRMGKVDDISNLRKEAARKRWERKASEEAAVEGDCTTNANAMQVESICKPNKTKPKQTKADQSITPPIPPSASSAAVAEYLNRVNPTASQRSLEELAAYEGTMGTEVCKRAIEIALDNKKPTWAYIRAILQRWAGEGVKCIADIEALEARHEQQKRSGGKYKPGAGATAPQPTLRGEADQRAREDMEALRRLMQKGG